MIGFAGIKTLIKNTVGIVGDFIPVPFTFRDARNTIMAFLQTGYYHIHGVSWIYPDKANPVQLTSSASAWSESGVLVEIIPANTFTRPFDIHWCSISEISADLFGIIDIFAGGIGAETKIGSIDVSRTAAFSREGAAPVQIPQQPANTRISARLSDSTSSARTVRIKLYGHVYGSSLT